MKSMTGFGRGEKSGADFSISIELKTVNNRYLDTNIRLSNELQVFENDLKKAISNRLSRGRIEVSIQYDRTTPVNYELNRPLIGGYLKALGQIKSEYDLDGDPDLAFVSRLPNALVPQKADFDENFASGLNKAMESALDALETMRETEGENLKKDLISQLAVISERLPVIESEADGVAGEYLERLEKKIAALLEKTDSPVELDKARLAQEAAFIADKSDISEEIARLKSHIEQFEAIMEDEGVVGKRLDFLTQELNREANTIGSKTQNLVIKESALEIKAAIEKIREQVQNVE